MFHSVVLRMLIFIAVAKFNYIYIYSGIHQIKTNESERGLAWFENICADVSEGPDSSSREEEVMGF